MPCATNAIIFIEIYASKWVEMSTVDSLSTITVTFTYILVEKKTALWNGVVTSYSLESHCQWASLQSGPNAVSFAMFHVSNAILTVFMHSVSLSL